MGSRDNPYAIGQALTVTLDTFGDADGSVWTLIVDGPGSDITRAVEDENQFNDPPPADSIFYGVPVTLTLESADKEPLSPLGNLRLEFFGPSTLGIIGGLSSPFGCGVAPGELDRFKEVFAGGAISGVVCFPVTNADAAAGVLLTLDSNEGDRIFIATK